MAGFPEAETRLRLRLRRWRRRFVFRQRQRTAQEAVGFSKRRGVGVGGKFERDVFVTTGTLVNEGTTILYRASKHDCQACALKSRCCPNFPARRVPRSIYEGARDVARQIAKSWEGHTSRRLRKKVEMLFAHLKRILKLDRLRLRGPNGARDEFILAATAQNLRKLAKLIPMPIPTAA